MTRMRFFGMVVNNGVHRKDIPLVVGAQLAKVNLLDSSQITRNLKLVEDTEIGLGEVPDVPLFKMTKKSHKEIFFDNGAFKLGTFESYAADDNPEIGDKSEGMFVLAGYRAGMLKAATVGGGFDHYVFCMYAGQPSGPLVQDFGYDSTYQVCDLVGFAEAVKEELGAIEYKFSLCAYSDAKAVVTNNYSPQAFQPISLSGELLNLVNEAKYFVKPIRYAPQQELRIIWRMPSAVEGPIILNVPNAIQFCKP